jgi:[ribosomal protein S5]-alanine N-acetyltransferase
VAAKIKECRGELQMTQQFRTERLWLKILVEADADKVLDFVQRNKEFLKEWEPERESDYYTLLTQAQLLAADKKLIESGQMLKVWIFRADDTQDRTIGSLSLSNIVRGAFQSCHLGYRIDEQEQSQGYMTEALKRLITVAFQEMNLHRLEANIMPRNEASLSVVRKLGFKEEGLAKRYLKINGKWEDHIHMVLLNDQAE